MKSAPPVSLEIFSLQKGSGTRCVPLLFEKIFVKNKHISFALSRRKRRFPDFLNLLHKLHIFILYKTPKKYLTTDTFCGIFFYYF